MTITLFESGKEVKEGDIFIAKIDYIEGHRRVTLEKIDLVKLQKDFDGFKKFVKEEFNYP